MSINRAVSQFSARAPEDAAGADKLMCATAASTSAYFRMETILLAASYATGGDARGDGAFDAQQSRVSDDQVASGDYASIGGGQNNKANGDNAAIGGGLSNEASGAQATIGGGSGNVNSGTVGTIGGGLGLEVTGDYGAAIGGNGNACSGTGAANGGGRNCLSSGSYSFTVGDGCLSSGAGANARGLHAVAVAGEDVYGYSNGAGTAPTQRLQGQTSTTSSRDMTASVCTWPTSTDASRKARVVHQVFDTAAREVMRWEASGTAAMVGFLGASAAIRQTGGAATASGSYTATEQLMLQKVYDALRTFGLLT